MADDIDIEEHDVLDNPVIRNIFPDISVIKKEISQYYVDVPDIKQDPETTATTEKVLADPVIPNNTTADKSASPCTEQASSKNHTSKLSVDKPKSKNYELKTPFQTTKIILGTKPNKPVEKIREGSNVDKEPNIILESVIRIPKVILQDLGEYIYESDRYCGDCKTLFPSKSDFQDHKLKLHCITTLNKPTDVKVTSKRAVLDKNNKCNICGFTFSLKSNLFRHYKNVHRKIMTTNHNHKRNASRITSSDVQCDFNSGDRNETTMNTRNKHINIKVILEETESKKKEKAAFKQTKRNVPSKSKCNICGSYFNNNSNLNRHYKNIHKKVSLKSKYENYRSINRANANSRMASINKATRSQSKCVKPDSKNVCFHCNKEFFDQNSLIEHIYTILGPKQYQKRDNSKVLNLVREKYVLKKETKHNELGDTNTEGIRMKDKLIFENQDSDASDCPLSETEKIKNDYNTKIKSKENHTVLTSLDKDHTESDTDYESGSTNQFSPKSLRNKYKHDLSEDTNSIASNVSNNDKTKENQSFKSSSLLKKQKFETKTYKRKHNLSDDDSNSMEWSFMDETNKTQTSHKSFNKKRKLGTKHKTSSKSASINNSKDVKLDTSNKDKTSKIKRDRSKNSLRFIPVSKNDIGNRCIVTDTFVYECIYCTYITLTSRAYCMHMFSKHKRENVTRVNKAIFDRKCKYCPVRTSKRSHNRHIRLSHFDLFTKPYNGKGEDRKKEPANLKMPGLKKKQSFVLKSKVFKCTKCDVHFLSSCITKDHEKHMELLINWKCSICKKIFKSNDKHLHLKQHNFSETVNVYQFDQSELSKLLYNCTKCAIHFTEERYLQHYSKCGHQTTDSVYCKNCDILIDKRGYASHEIYHKTEKNTADIIVITGDLITKNNDESKSQENTNSQREFHSLKKSITSDLLNKQKKLEYSEESNIQVKSNSQEESESHVDTNSKKILSSNEKENKNKIMNSKNIPYNPMNCLTFCQTCKCFLSDIAVSRKSHIEARCSKMVKYTCPKCGLVFTNKTINTHRTHHKKVKGLQLQDFEFFDLDGFQIRPPIPEYPSCSHCEVMFVGRNAVKGHICSETEFFTCEVCNVKLSENAFKLHMNFHRYCMPNEIVDQALNLVLTESHPKDNGPAKQVKALNQSSVTIPKTDKPKGDMQVESQERNVEVDKNPSSGLMLEDAMLKEKIGNSLTLEAANLPTVSSVIESNHIDATESNAGNSIILYTCQSCKISVDTYDKVVHHCQNHFNPNPTISSTSMICSKCSLRFEIDTYETHQKLNLGCDTIQVLSFDPTYFTSDHDTWTRHIFSSVSPSILKKAIGKSMYQHECRIKMEVIQRGPSYLTVYKCNRCCIFIDPECVISHIKEGCPKIISKHPCPVCGLPFISYLSRTNHEKIHRRHDNVRLKSYNIILINCEAHNSYNANILNAIKQYTLYQCRTCEGIVDKSQRNDHICNVDDLQKCLLCGLILYKDDFDKHISRHSDLAMYNTVCMKVVLFGNRDQSVQNKKLSSTFNGVICDYKLYKCSQCDECENDKKTISRHICSLDDSKWKCPKCCNYISARSIKQHIKMHDVDAEYVADNITVIGFGFLKDKDFNAERAKEKNRDNNDSAGKNTNYESKHKADQTVTGLLKEHLDVNSNNNSQNSGNNYDKETVVLYKCSCGLHYMDKTTAKNHVKLCCPKLKIIRQNCSKCSLKFNPKELFSHILAHHSDKNKTVSYNVIELERNT